LAGLLLADDGWILDAPQWAHFFIKTTGKQAHGVYVRGDGQTDTDQLFVGGDVIKEGDSTKIYIHNAGCKWFCL